MSFCYRSARPILVAATWTGQRMEPKSLRAVKLRRDKRLPSYEFKTVKRNSLPPPLSKVCGSRRQSTGMIPVADDLAVCFIWRNGEIVEATAMYGYLFEISDGRYRPLIRMDWHPSHKGLHVLTSCETELDLTGRNLVGCKELALSKDHSFDVRMADDRARFVDVFCTTCNIRLGTGALL